MSAKKKPPRDRAYAWGGEHFCEPDLNTLNREEPRRISALGFPAELPDLPETFCSTCLRWFTGPHPEGSEHRPPSKGLTHGDNT